MRPCARTTTKSLGPIPRGERRPARVVPGGREVRRARVVLEEGGELIAVDHGINAVLRLPHVERGGRGASLVSRSAIGT